MAMYLRSLQLRNSHRFELAMRTAVQLATGQLDLSALAGPPRASRDRRSTTHDGDGAMIYD